MSSAVQKATRAIGGTVSIGLVRNPADGGARWAVLYTSKATHWQSPQFDEVSQAEAAALVLATFLGARLSL
ncbi:hypothetical protein [Bradyrhizobium sp. USDA 4502]